MLRGELAAFVAAWFFAGVTVGMVVCPMPGPPDPYTGHDYVPRCSPALAGRAWVCFRAGRFESWRAP